MRREGGREGRREGGREGGREGKRVRGEEGKRKGGREYALQLHVQYDMSLGSLWSIHTGHTLSAGGRGEGIR